MSAIQLRRGFLVSVLSLIHFLCSCFLFGMDRHKMDGRGKHWKEVINLEGDWNFTIGDNIKWKEKNYEDHHWERIRVPSTWEDEGFHGYNGYAWYRHSFQISSKDLYSSLYLFLGVIDDVDEVYVNGTLIGKSGSFPPNYATAYNAFRSYAIPSGILDSNGKNVIAVRVYDSQLEGGIIRGKVGIFKNLEEFAPLIDLRGIWKFHRNDIRGDIEEIDVDDEYNEQQSSSWGDVIVPSAWEDQGYWFFDGIGWYMKKFELPREYRDEDLILILGKIDDFDQVYVNYTLVGQTNDHKPFGVSQSYKKLRTYLVPAELFSKEKDNIIMVRVEDIGHVGGIYEGPIGFIRP